MEIKKDIDNSGFVIGIAFQLKLEVAEAYVKVQCFFDYDDALEWQKSLDDGMKHFIVDVKTAKEIIGERAVMMAIEDMY